MQEANDIDVFIKKEGRKRTIRFILGYVLAVFLTFFICFYEFPYYIDKPGGLDNINDKVKVDGAYRSEGSINLTYVGELKGTLPFLFLAWINPDWTIVPKESPNDLLDHATDMIRQKILMKQSYTTSIMYAYQKADKKVDIVSENIYVTYIFEEANTDLKVGDQIISVDGKKIKNNEEFHNIVSSHQVGDESKIVVKNNDNEYTRTVKYVESDNQVVVGIQIGIEYLLETTPNYEFKYNSLEYGPSGGLMISLAVYNSLVKEDITKGYKIAGTGTLDEDGNVGPVGGIEYKLKGAVKGGAIVFFAPSDENYDEAMAIKKKKKYDIDIVRVSTFDDALAYLMKLKEK